MAKKSKGSVTEDSLYLESFLQNKIVTSNIHDKFISYYTDKIVFILFNTSSGFFFHFFSSNWIQFEE